MKQQSRSQISLEDANALFAVLHLGLGAFAKVEAVVEAIVVVLASEGHTIVPECASTLDAVNLARFIVAELAEVALVPADGNADLGLITSELILNVAALRIAANKILIYRRALSISLAC